MIWLYIGLALIIVLLIVWLVASYKFFQAFIVRKTSFEIIQERNNNERQQAFIKADEASRAYLKTQKLEDVNIQSDDGLKLHGYFIQGKSGNNHVAIIAHGYVSDGTCMGENARIYLERGYNVLLIDMRTHGQSEGKYYGMSCVEPADLVKWVAFVNQRFHNQCTIVLHGVSMGAATILGYFRYPTDPNVKLIIEDSGFANVATIVKEIGASFGLKFLPLMMAGMNLFIKTKAGYSLYEHNPKDAIVNAKIPGVFIHGTADTLILPHNCDEAFELYSGPKEKHIIEGATHALARNQFPKEYRQIVENALDHYLDR